MSAVGSSDSVGRAVCALTGAWRAEGRGIAARREQGRGREAAEPPTHSIADGTALRCGRVGSRQFENL